MITRKDKIIYLTGWYKVELGENLDSDLIFPVLNQIIIDAVGISGLKEVKKNAYE